MCVRFWLGFWRCQTMTDFSMPGRLGRWLLDGLSESVAFFGWFRGPNFAILSPFFSWLFTHSDNRLLDDCDTSKEPSKSFHFFFHFAVYFSSVFSFLQALRLVTVELWPHRFGILKIK